MSSPVYSFSLYSVTHGWNFKRSNMMNNNSNKEKKSESNNSRISVKCNSNSSEDSSNSGGGFGQSNTTFNNKNKKKMKNKKNDQTNTNTNTNTNYPPGLSLSSPARLPDSTTNRLRTTNATTSSPDFQFEQRLQAIKRSALEQKKQLDQQATNQFGAIDYDQPPPQPNTNSTDPPKPISLGTKVGVGVAVVVFGLVFALGDFLPSTSSDAPSNKVDVVDSQLSVEEKQTLQARLQQFEAALTATPKDSAAVEGVAVTLAELGEYSRAASLLEDLTKMKPKDPDAFRLLGEVKYQLKDYEASAAAYKTAATECKTVNFEVVQGLTNALLAGRRPEEAVQVLLVTRERLSENKMAEGSADDAKSEVVDPVQVELLLGKAYSDWGHVSDAVSVYDQLISTHPDDFRGYLAKGIILKQNGRAGDAERMFIQARFFAPEKAKALVDRYSRT